MTLSGPASFFRSLSVINMRHSQIGMHAVQWWVFTAKPAALVYLSKRCLC